ncbi:putative receptor-like protein kinase At3g47110 [Morus notabilis]|uniref:putative receptor-like protein kinase At3g47110 n=1 Tax=Morus notabilis TaxID=981085 RepID=UPI000CED09A3|nr:putative receptor-like protein kinase At3g47110 [Morus notabilis]
MKLENLTSSFAFWSLFLHVILLYFVSLLQQTGTVANTLGNETDRFALLKFKEMISSGPYGVMSSWNDSVHFCKWPGISCGKRHQRITALDLHGYNLRGLMSPYIGNLSFLRFIYLGENSFFGEIPPQVGHLRRLRHLNLSYNMLQGKIPVNLSHCSKLRILRLRKNKLTGVIPLELGSLLKLVELGLSVDNHFKGILPPNIGFTLPNLQIFFISGNEFSGTIPSSIPNATELQVFECLDNKFFGQVPTNLGNLPDLRWLGLGRNILGNNSANSLDFIPPLTNCSKLEILGLSENNFGGVLPNSIANLSTRLTKLFLEANQISGSIPTSLENLVNLMILSMWDNRFTGVIPTSLGKLQNLQVLYLDHNRLSGKIPSSIGNLIHISDLFLGHNRLEGTLPPNFANLRNMQYLDISNNNLGGAIPKGVLSLLSPIHFDFSSNSFTGSLPMEVGKLKNINQLDLSENNLTSEIPETIGDCQTLEFLLLQGNSFQGIMPSTLASLREGEVPKKGVFQNASAVSFVRNSKLCGGVPKLQLPPCPIKASKKRMTVDLKLKIIIVSVVVLFLLLSALLVFYWRRKYVSKSPSALLEISFLSTVSYKRLYQATSGFSPSMLIGTGSFGSVYKGILEQEESVVAVKVLNLQQKGASKSFIDECKALRNIRHRNLVKILTCCSSMDYKGNDFKALIFEYMSNGSLDKWLHSLEGGNNQSMGLNLIQRLNIAIDVASAIDYLHDHCEQSIIHCDLKPSNVLLDNEMIGHVSDFGLARLVSNTTGLSASQSSTIGIKGTIGYIAPEYATGGEPSKQGDVYSYGILVLEMFTGRRPTDEMFKDDFNLHNFVKMALPERLVRIVDSSLLPTEVEENATRASEDRRDNGNNGSVEIDIEEENIDFENRNQISAHLQKCLVSVLEIGLACSKESPNERINIGDVTRELQHIKNAFMDVEVRGQRRRSSQIRGA